MLRLIPKYSKTFLKRILILEEERFNMEIDPEKFWATLHKIVAEDRKNKKEEKEENLNLNSNLEIYQNAGSFEEALDIFFKNVINSFKDINKISYTPFDAALIPPENELKGDTTIDKRMLEDPLSKV